MSRPRLAIFEDDIVNRFLYQRLLEKKENIDFSIFGDPKKGLHAATQTSFDIIFIEVHFWRNFGGISLLEELRKTSPVHTVFVAMTSLLQEGDAERLLKAGFTMCVEKPVVFADEIFRARMKRTIL